MGRFFSPQFMTPVYITRLKFIVYYFFCFTKNGILNFPITLQIQLAGIGKNSKDSHKYRTYNFRGFDPEDLSSRRRPRS